MALAGATGDSCCLECRVFSCAFFQRGRGHHSNHRLKLYFRQIWETLTLMILGAPVPNAENIGKSFKKLSGASMCWRTEKAGNLRFIAVYAAVFQGDWAGQGPKICAGCGLFTCLQLDNTNSQEKLECHKDGRGAPLLGFTMSFYMRLPSCNQTSMALMVWTLGVCISGPFISLVSWTSAIFERIWSLSSALDASQAWMSLDKNRPLIQPWKQSLHFSATWKYLQMIHLTWSDKDWC